MKFKMSSLESIGNLGICKSSQQLWCLNKAFEGDKHHLNLKFW